MKTDILCCLAHLWFMLLETNFLNRDLFEVFAAAVELEAIKIEL